jgi:hypothetical protein
LLRASEPRVGLSEITVLAENNRGLPAAVALVCSALALLGAEANAQSAAPSSPAADGRKTVRMVRSATPPVIDGKLDEAVWQTADVITDFHQIRPGDGATPSEPTSRPRSISSTTTTRSISARACTTASPR